MSDKALLDEPTIASIIRQHHRTHVRQPRRTNEPRRTFHQGDKEAAQAILEALRSSSAPQEPVVDDDALIAELHRYSTGDNNTEFGRGWNCAMEEAEAIVRRLQAKAPEAGEQP